MSTVIIKTMTRILTPAILVFGVYIIIHGHLTPGGGFQGGAVFASGLILVIIAFSRNKVKEMFEKVPLSVLESIGALGFLGIGLMGIAGYTFLRNFIANSGILFGSPTPEGINPGYLNTGGTLPYLNIFVGLKVLAGLTSIVLVLFLILRGEKNE
ncbi:MAG TPA: sodium:proton antiporter [Euryarchaeota archaeon]|nr:sodium:proton antiporter [Euryarchaeota archaeon]